MVLDQSGTLANVKRHDYLPFGEELFAGTGGRTVAQGYAADGVRQQFTAYERDSESGLDFAEARFYSSSQGRFTSVDPLMRSAVTANPQTFNRYSYVGNSPLSQVDPTGMLGINPPGGSGGIPLISSDCQENEELQQSQQQPQEPPVATNQVTVGNITVTVEQVDAPAAFNGHNINGVLRTGVGVQLVFTFTENGKPVTGATVTESVKALKGEAITQNNQPVALDQRGRGSDFVTNSAPTPTNREQAQNLYDRLTKPFETEQKATFKLTLATGKTIEITQIRSLTNLTPKGTLQPHDRTLGTPGYTFKMQPLKARVVKG
jgi:RHS repeat-associated protein